MASLQNGLKTPLSYYGGKQNMLSEIIPLIPDHGQYIEPFVGGGALFWAKPGSPSEVINDLDGRVTNFYRVVQLKFGELQQLIQATPHSEIEYRRARQMLMDGTGTDVERAWAVWVQTRMSFSNIMLGGFAFSSVGQARVTANARDKFTEVYMERMRNVEIFQRDALELIKMKDHSDAFFYCDPPYTHSDQGHYKGYSDKDFKNLLDTLSGIKGKFLLSSYPVPDLKSYREENGWNSKDVKQSLAVNGKRGEKKFKIEAVTWNYDTEFLFM